MEIVAGAKDFIALLCCGGLGRAIYVMCGFTFERGVCVTGYGCPEIGGANLTAHFNGEPCAGICRLLKDKEILTRGNRYEN